MKAKYPEIFYSPQSDGSGLLVLTWAEGPYGLGLEPKQGFGVGFFGGKGDLLSVQFFDVESNSDHQTLVFENGISVSVKTANGKVKEYKVSNTKSSKKIKKAA